MPRSLKLLIAGVVAASAFALVATTFVFPITSGIALPNAPDGVDPTLEALLLGVGFWIVLTSVASALPVQMPRGSQQAVSFAPMVAAVVLGGPTAGAWVAAIGTVLCALRAAWRPRYGPLVLAAAVASLAAVILAQGSGEKLEDEVRETDLVEEHTEHGEEVLPWAIEETVAAAL